jgi:hypothetical protein
MSWPSVLLDPADASIGFAFINSIGAVGGFAGPVMLGTLAEHSGGYSAAMLVLALLLFVSGTAILRERRRAEAGGRRAYGALRGGRRASPGRCTGCGQHLVKLLPSTHATAPCPPAPLCAVFPASGQPRPAAGVLHGGGLSKTSSEVEVQPMLLSNASL